MEPLWRPAYVAIGGNLDDPRAHVQEAFERLARLPRTRLEARSRLYSTKPLGPQDQPDFVNAAAGLLTQSSARELLDELLGIEQANLSQHLAILRSRQIVANRKEGNQVFYSLRNRALIEVLDMMRRYFQAHLAEEVQMLGEIEAEDPARRKERLD